VKPHKVYDCMNCRIICNSCFV